MVQFSILPTLYCLDIDFRAFELYDRFWVLQEISTERSQTKVRIMQEVK